jgi:hypothetical protein
MSQTSFDALDGFVVACGCTRQRVAIETRPSLDPHQAALEAGLREARGLELVRDPQERV